MTEVDIVETAMANRRSVQPSAVPQVVLLRQLEALRPEIDRMASGSPAGASARTNLEALDRLRLRVLAGKVGRAEAQEQIDRIRERHRRDAADLRDRRVRQASLLASAHTRLPHEITVYTDDPRNVVGSEPPPSHERWTPNARSGFYTPAECSEMSALRKKVAEDLNTASTDRVQRAVNVLAKRHRDARKALLDAALREVRINRSAPMDQILDELIHRLTDTSKPPRHEIGTEIPRLFANHVWDEPNRVSPTSRDLWRKDQYRER